MLREIAHFLRHAPATMRLKLRTSSQAELYDTLMSRGDADGMASWRRELVGDLAGEVLEIGSGTGLMFPHYGSAARITAVEPDADFSSRSRPRVSSAKAMIRLVGGNAMKLPVAAGSFDHVVIALVLCSVLDPVAALREVVRAVRPGGEVRLIEHVRSRGAVAGTLMDLGNPVWRLMNGQGCNMNRDTEALLERSGYRLLEVRPFEVFTPGIPAFPMRWIRAVAPAWG